VSRFLLDVNVLIALIDPAHIKHDPAHHWLASIGKQTWATCPMTENGVLRIVGNPRYINSQTTPAAIVKSVMSLLALPGHEFWPDNISLLDKKLIDPSRLLTSAQITDTYLLALAVANKGKLATFDQRLVRDAVIGGGRALHLIR
jgi:toxin-antitoxin system PIN domain toxin